jgi:hypothetical protein
MINATRPTSTPIVSQAAIAERPRSSSASTIGRSPAPGRVGTLAATTASRASFTPMRRFSRLDRKRLGTCATWVFFELAFEGG